MLIAMMNDSYSQTLAVQKYHWRVDSVQIGVNIERLLPWLPKLFSKIKHRSIPGEDEDYGVKKYYITLSEEEFEAKYGQMLDNEAEKKIHLRRVRHGTRRSFSVVVTANKHQHICSKTCTIYFATSVQGHARILASACWLARTILTVRTYVHACIYQAKY